MSDEQIQTQEANIETPASEPSTDIVVSDSQSYAELIKSKVSQSKDTPTESKPRDEKGRFRKDKEQEVQETSGETSEEVETPDETSEQTEQKDSPAQETPDKQKKLDDLAKKIEAEKSKRKQELETKQYVDEYKKLQPFLQSFQRDKLGTLDKLLDDKEFERLCDIRIARLNGQPTTTSNDEITKKVDQKLAELERRTQEAAAVQAKANYGRLVDNTCKQFPDYELANDWCKEQGYDFTTTCVEYADKIVETQGFVPTPEQAIDAVISYVKQDMDTIERVKSKRTPKPASEPEVQESKPSKKPRTINSTLKGTTHKAPEIRVTDKESYAELIKQRVKQSK